MCFFLSCKNEVLTVVLCLPLYSTYMVDIPLLISNSIASVRNAMEQNEQVLTRKQHRMTIFNFSIEQN